MGNEPQITFSTCFGAPFLALPPEVYAKLFREKIREYKPTCWLVNTGWTGGPFGVGHRMAIAHSRALLNAAMSGKLDEVPTYQDPYFGLTVPTTCPGVPDSILYPQKTWADPQAYETTAKDLARRFRENFTKYAANVEPEVLAAEPK